jgi:hypothetical protein
VLVLVLVLVLSEAVLVFDWGKYTVSVDSITVTSTVASD